MAREIEEYKLKIRTLEQEVVHYKGNITSLEFKACAFELQDELKTIQKYMYTSLKEFQDIATQFLTF
jgi:hypothetical protein